VSDTMSWSWIGIAVFVPLALSMAVAWPFWGRSRDSLGSIAGTFVIFMLAIAFVGTEYIYVQRVTGDCIAAETVCHFYPEPFTRFGLYGFIAMIQAFVLFAVGAWIEGRIENLAFAAEWRR
jgi:hypothetical protein